MNLAVGGAICRSRSTQAAGGLIIFSTPEMTFVIRHAGMPFTQTGRFRALTLGAFAVVYILWGSTYLAIAVAVQSIPPFLLIGVAPCAGAIVGIRGVSKSRYAAGSRMVLAAASGVLLFGGCHGTLAYAEKYVSSGLAAVTPGTIPFWIVLIKFVIPAEDRPKTMTLAALVPGLAGVALFMLPRGPQEAGPIAPEMVLILLGSAFLWALGSIVSQRQSPSIPATTSAGMQLLCGGAALLVASSLKGELAGFSPSQISPISWAGLGYLTFAGSVVAFTAYVWLLDHVRAPLVATYTFVNPIIAVGLGWALLGERLTLPMLAGFVASCRFSNRGVAARSRRKWVKKTSFGPCYGRLCDRRLRVRYYPFAAVCERPLVAATV